MDGLENVISVLDYVLDTKRKRHIMGGILLSVSFLFGGLAITVMTIRNEEEEDEQQRNSFPCFYCWSRDGLCMHMATAETKI